MKNSRMFILVLLIGAAALFGSCNKRDSVKVTGVELDHPSLVMKIGETQTIKATVSPGNADNKNVSWKSDDESVVTVSNGVVTAIANGNAKITATTEDGGFTKECNVTVEAAIAVDPNVTDIEFSVDGKTLYANGETISATFTVTSNDEWNISVESDWCSVKKSGFGFIVSATANSQPVSPAPATIVITAGDAEPVNINVTQRAFPVLTVSPEAQSVSFLWDGQKATIDGADFNPAVFIISTNQESWSIELEGTGNWCSADINGNTLTLSAAANDSKNERGLTLIISAGDAEPLHILVRQEGKPVEHDIYVGGWDGANGINNVVYWKNGEGTTVYSGASFMNTIEVTSMHLNENDIYLTGYEKTGTYNVPTYWKNGTPKYLTSTTWEGTMSPPVRAGAVNAVTVYEGKVYAAGNIQQSVLKSDGTSSQTQHVTKLWIDDQDIDMSTTDAAAYGTSMHIHNNKVYIGGYQNLRPVYWIYDIANKTASKIILNESMGTVYSIYVNGDDGAVYACGTLGSKAVYWKDGGMIELAAGVNGSESARSIKVQNGIVYVAGTSYPASGAARATYWVNGIAHLTSTDVARPMSYGLGIYITDGGDVYVSGYEHDNDSGFMNQAARYWKNGEKVKLVDDYSYKSSASSIVAVEKD